MKKILLSLALLVTSHLAFSGTVTDLKAAADQAKQASDANPSNAALKAASDKAAADFKTAANNALANKASNPVAAKEAMDALGNDSNTKKKTFSGPTAGDLSAASASTGNNDDDACKLYLCLMGTSESDGGPDCQTRIQQYTAKFNGSCPDLPTCIGTPGPKTSGVLMMTASATGGSTQESSIKQACVEEDTMFGTYCEIALSANATSAFGFNEASCGGN